MVRQQGSGSQALRSDEIAIIAHAYDLALRQVTDADLVLQGWPSSDVKARMSLAILALFRSGVSDAQVLSAAGIAAATTHIFEGNARSGPIGLPPVGPL